MSDHMNAAQVVDHALSCATTADCIVVVEDAHEADVRFANNTTTTNGVRHDRSVTVIAIADRKDGRAIGVASKSGFVEIEDLVRAAEHECAQAPLADDAAPLIASTGVAPDFDAPSPTTDLSVLKHVLNGFPDAFALAASEGTALAGFAQHAMTTTLLGTSAGVRLRHTQPIGTMELVARDTAGKRSVWSSAGTGDFSEVNVSAMHAHLRKRLSWANKRIDLQPGRYEVILPPDAVADLMIPLFEATSGRDAEDGQNVFSKSGGGTRIGDQLSAQPLTLYSDPTYSGLECAPYLVTGGSGTDVSVFDNASPIDRIDWIANGDLNRLRYFRSAAKRTKATFTPPTENLIMEVAGATATLDEMIASTTRGLLVTCLWYIREVDLSTLLLTGLTRDGVYLIENGEVVGAVNNFRFNESPVDMLGRIIEAGGTTRALSREWNEWMSLTAMPPLRVADFNMSSISPAN